MRYIGALLAICISMLGMEKLEAASAYAQLSSVVTQVPSSGEGSPVMMEKADVLKNFDLSSKKDKLIVKETGVYLVIAAGQVAATRPGATGYVDCWFVKNNLPLPNSAVRLSIDTSISTGLLISQSILELAQDDSLEIFFTASGPSLGFVFIKPEVAPAIPSFIFSITKLD